MVASAQMRKSGLSVVECVVALAILGAMLTTLLSIQVVQSLRVGLDNQRIRAEQTLTNLADRVLSADASQLTEDTLTEWGRDLEEADGLPAGTLQVVVHPETNPVAGNRYELIWNPHSSELPTQRLVVWRFSADGSTETEDPS